MDAYMQWKRYQAVEQMLSKKLSGNRMYEIKNIIERFVIAERQATPDNYNEIVDKFRSEIVEKNLDKKIGEEILTMMGVEIPKVNNDRIQYGELSVVIQPSLLDALKKFPNYNPIDIVKLHAEYNIGANNSNQWSIPGDTYKKIHTIITGGTGDSGSVKRVIEGCASIFNSKLLPLLAPEKSYCSLYPLEQRYGSLGTLNQALDDPLNADVFWVVNPPFIESIMLSLGEQLLADDKREFFWIMPYWADSPAYTIFQEKTGDNCRLKMRILRKNTYAYQSGDTRIIAKFDSVVFTTDQRLLQAI